MGVGSSSKVSYPKTFHLGFILPSEAEVNAINLRLMEDGFDVDAPGCHHGAWSFSCRAPGGFSVGVRC